MQQPNWKSIVDWPTEIGRQQTSLESPDHSLVENDNKKTYNNNI